MKKLGRLTWILFFVFLFAFSVLFVWQYFDGGDKTVGNSEELYFRQKRSFRKKLVLLSDFEFYYKSTRFTVVDSEIYLWNFSNREVNKYSANGDLLETYGQFGNGPEDLDRVVQIKVNKDRVILFDAGNSALKEFDRATAQFISSSKIEYPIDKGIFYGDDQIYLQSYGKAGSLSFGIYDQETKEVDSDLAVNELFNDIPDSGLIYDGFFAPTECGVFYVSYQMPEIYRLDNKGNVDFNVKTIYNVPAPTIVKTANITAPQNTFIHLMGLYADCYKIYLLTSVVNADSQRVVDIYDVADGEYMESIVVPSLPDGQNPTEIVVEGNKWYILYDEKLVVYEVE